MRMENRTHKRSMVSFVLCGFFLLCACSFAAADQAEIISVNGTVEVLLEGADEYAAAQEGMALEAGDTIKTSDGGSAELSFNEANTNVVRLNENTDAEVVLSGDEKLSMTTGEVFASVSELAGGSSFEIRTPTAVSGARGTDWVTKVSGEGTDVEAIDSIPYVRHFESAGVKSAQMTMIQPGQMTTVKRFQPPMQPRPMAAGRQQKWQDMKQQVRRRAGEAVIKRQERPQFNRKDFIQEMKGKKARPEDGFKPLVSGDRKRAEQADGQQLKQQAREQQLKQQFKEQEPRKDKELKVQEQFKQQAPQKLKELQAQERSALHNAGGAVEKKAPLHKKPVPQKNPKK